MEVGKDWSYLDQWIADAQSPEREEWQGGQSGLSMNLLVSKELDELGAPRLLLFKDTFAGKLNPAFAPWWNQNKASVLARSPK
jgi:hypothetical protein